jgi:hypothetical protein
MECFFFRIWNSFHHVRVEDKSHQFCSNFRWGIAIGETWTGSHIIVGSHRAQDFCLLYMFGLVRICIKHGDYDQFICDRTSILQDFDNLVGQKPVSQPLIITEGEFPLYTCKKPL